MRGSAENPIRRMRNTIVAPRIRRLGTAPVELRRFPPPGRPRPSSFDASRPAPPGTWKGLGMTDARLDELCINTIRTLSIDAVQKANSGHPGAPMGAAAMAYTLWDRFLRHNPPHPQWPNRERFVLSPR